MTNVLITGATGNVGLEVIRALSAANMPLRIVAGVRNLATDASKLAAYNCSCTPFDFTDARTYNAALSTCDVLFLLRPPQIAEVDKYFKPLITLCKEFGVKHIIFLSVQGVERSKIIPHYKIEELIVESKIPYTFLRPAYFMQNFSSTLHSDLVNNDKIFLPAGAAKFTLIDIRDIAAVTAVILRDLSPHLNKGYELTSENRLTFREMAQALSKILDRVIQYESPNLLRFFWLKKKEGTPIPFILVMIMLHYLPRFQRAPRVTNCVEEITGKKPIRFENFVDDHRKLLSKP